MKGIDKQADLSKIKRAWAINSVEECYLHTVEVAGSNPASPTIPLLHETNTKLASIFGPFSM